METKKLTCVVCPRGCALEADVENSMLVAVRGNTCKRGAAYAEAELFHAERTLTSTVMVNNRPYMLPVRTRTAIPKEKLWACMEMIQQTAVTAPIAVGAVLIPDVLGTGVDIVASAACD